MLGRFLKSDDGAQERAMRPNRQVGVYRPRQVLLASDTPRHKKRGAGLLAANQCKLLGLMAMAACVIGLVLTHCIHARVTDLQAKAAQLQASYSAFADENTRLVATEGQAASKIQVVALAKRKLKLFEPDHGQVRRM